MPLIRRRRWKCSARISQNQHYYRKPHTCVPVHVSSAHTAGWALTFAHELTLWEDKAAVQWLTAVRPFADVITELFLAWLPMATYPIRVGLHSNSPFGLARSVPWAKYLSSQGDPRLLTAITHAATQWYGEDRDYPAGYEPSGSGFLSPALTEVDLMSLVLEREEFLRWLDRSCRGFHLGFPGLAERRPVPGLTKPRRRSWAGIRSTIKSLGRSPLIANNIFPHWKK